MITATRVIAVARRAPTSATAFSVGRAPPNRGGIRRHLHDSRTLPDVARARSLPASSSVVPAPRIRHPAGRERSSIAANALPETLFSAATVAVLPLYGMMIGAPGAKVSRAVMSSWAPFAAMGCMYAAALVTAFQSAGAHAVWSTFVSAFASGADVGASVLTLISGFLAVTETAAGAWLHLLSLDLFVARHVFLDALHLGVPAAHSLVLCCMFGPCGYLAHTLTKAAMGKGGVEMVGR